MVIDPKWWKRYIEYSRPVVRMAELSKAPDSRVESFLVKGTSGLHMEAWVQISLLTDGL